MADEIVPEEWRRVEGFPDYEVSDLGRIRAPFGKVLKPTIAHNGYLRVVIYSREKKIRRTPVHRIVCENFHGPAPSPLHEVAHEDRDRQNNRADNLRWVTHTENAADAIRHGTTCRGSKNGMVKLSETEVKEIRAAYRKSKKPKGLAIKYGVSGSTLMRIKNRTAWAWLPD